MKKIKLIADSACDLPLDIIEKYNISIVHLNVLFGEDSFVDGRDNDKFYEKMKINRELPKTASPSPEKYIKEFECEEEEILVVTLSSGLSSTHSNAVLAKNMFFEDGNNKRIEIVDSLSGSLGEGLIVLKASKLIEEGYKLDDIIKTLKKEVEENRTYVALDTIENAVKAGRISFLKGKIAQVLNLKIIVIVEDGLVKVFDKARGDKKCFAAMMDIIEKANLDTSKKTLAIAHANALDKALAFKAIIEERFEFEEIIISQIGALIGTYSSDGAVLMAF